jgi:hypothetical protein
MPMKKCGAEFVFAGTGAIIINETTGGAITHVGISLTLGNHLNLSKAGWS